MEEAQFKWLPKFTAACAKAPEEQRGKLLWALAQYGTYGIEPELEWPLDAIFASVREDIDYSKRCIAAGKTGGRGNRKPPLDGAKPPFSESETQNDEPEFEEAWWGGTLLCEHEPHDPALYGYGHWAITDTKTGRTIEITEG